MTQVEVAQRLGRTQSYISKVEDGEIMIDAVVLFQLCRAVGIPFGEFATRFEKDWNEMRDKEITDDENDATDG